MKVSCCLQYAFTAVPLIIAGIQFPESRTTLSASFFKTGSTSFVVLISQTLPSAQTTNCTITVWFRLVVFLGRLPLRTQMFRFFCKNEDHAFVPPGKDGSI